MKLNDRHRQVADYYVAGYGKKAACVKAGMSPNSFKDVFERIEVQAYIREALDKISKQCEMDRPADADG